MSETTIWTTLRFIGSLTLIFFFTILGVTIINFLLAPLMIRRTVR